MKIRLMAILISSLTFSVCANSQELKSLTLEDLIPGGENYHKYQPEDIDGLQWWGNQCVFSNEGDTLQALNPQNGKTKILFTFEELNSFLSEKELNPVYRPDRLYFPEVEKQKVWIQSPGKGYALIDFKKWELLTFIPIPREAQNIDFCPENHGVAYTIGHNLYISTPQGQKEITKEPEGIVCGQSVHRQEFGINKGTFWSPDGNLLAFYRMDESMVTKYPLLNIDSRVAEVDYIRYPMAGMESHKVSIGIYNISEDTICYLDTGDPTDRYFTNISWSPDNGKIYLFELNRDQNHSKLVRYNGLDGKYEETIYEEHHSKYVHPRNPIYFLPWDSGLFLLQSEQDGYNHLYLYETSGKLIRQLTRGSWVVQKILGFDSSRKEIVFSSNQLSPLQSNIFRLHTSTSKCTLFGTDTGWHEGILSPDGQYLIDSYSAHDLPRRIVITSRSREKDLLLFEAENPFGQNEIPPIEVGTISASDHSVELFYRMVKPLGFDPEKKYPVIIYVYGGPGIRLITNQWLYQTRGWDIYMANRGYLVFTLDNRGSSERGFEFESCTFRKLGIEECKDQVKGVEYLRTLPYVDSTRIGAFGWSYGGYMTTSLMLRYPDLFKVGVAGGSVINWKFYEIMYGERYMDTPEKNPEGYEATDLTRLAGSLKGKLLMIQDTNDPVVVPQHTLSFLKACIESRTYPDYFEYPGHSHNVLGRDRIHLFEKITRYFDTNLK